MDFDHPELEALLQALDRLNKELNIKDRIIKNISDENLELNKMIATPKIETNVDMLRALRKTDVKIIDDLLNELNECRMAMARAIEVLRNDRYKSRIANAITELEEQAYLADWGDHESP